jgi:hypothetical protein
MAKEIWEKTINKNHFLIIEHFLYYQIVKNGEYYKVEKKDKTGKNLLKIINEINQGDKYE